MHPMERIIIPTSTQPPTKFSSTNNVLFGEDIETFQDIEYTEGEIRDMNFDNPFSKENPMVQAHY
jgi:hypothetical protein